MFKFDVQLNYVPSSLALLKVWWLGVRTGVYTSCFLVNWMRFISL